MERQPRDRSRGLKRNCFVSGVVRGSSRTHTAPGPNIYHLQSAVFIEQDRLTLYSVSPVFQMSFVLLMSSPKTCHSLTAYILQRVLMRTLLSETTDKTSYRLPSSPSIAFSAVQSWNYGNTSATTRIQTHPIHSVRCSVNSKRFNLPVARLRLCRERLKACRVFVDVCGDYA